MRRPRLVGRTDRRSSVKVCITTNGVEDWGVGIVLQRRPLTLLVAQHLVTGLEEDAGARVDVEGMTCRRVRLVSCNALERDHISVLQAVCRGLPSAIRAIVLRKLPRLAPGQPVRVERPDISDTLPYEGRIVSIKDRPHGATLVTDVPVQPGDSGSAVFTSNRFVAVCQGMIPTQHGGTAVAVPLSRESLRRLRALQLRNRTRNRLPAISLACLSMMSLAGLILGPGPPSGWGFLPGARHHEPPATITVGPGESLRTALGHAPDGAIVQLGAGVWEEHITLRRTVTLRGEGVDQTVLQGRIDRVPVITVHSTEAISVTMYGLTVRNARGDFTPGIRVDGRAEIHAIDLIVRDHPGSGIELRGSSRAVIERCTMTDSLRGVSLSQDAHAVIQQCFFSHHVQRPDSSHGNAVDLRDRSSAEIFDCTITENDWGVLGFGTSRCTITGCTISNSRFAGINITAGSHFVIENNELLGNGSFGVMLSMSQPGSEQRLAPFFGQVRGRGNQGSNLLANVWPSTQDGLSDDIPTLDFLMTEAGGEIDRTHHALLDQPSP